jgi:hypothetical protein
MSDSPIYKQINGWTTAAGFVLLRGLLFLLLPYSAYLGFGDQLNFYRIAQLPGWPFFQYWAEYPPVFPFLSAGIYRLAAGNEQVYCYTLSVILSLFDAGSILVFWQLLGRVDPEKVARLKLFVYSLVLCFFPYSWWYFESIPVFFLLLGLWLVLTNRTWQAGVCIAAGFLTKILPALALIAAWQYPKKRDFFIILGIFAFLILAIITGLFMISPEMTAASLSAQYSKGSWQTIWALLDGNQNTGSFGHLSERFDASMAFQARGNPARIPSLIPLITAGLLGIWLIWKSNNHTDLQRISLVGAGWTLLILASPGWSPQWILYIIPICLLVFSAGKAVGFVSILICLSLTEWPLIFSRWRVDLIAPLIIVRTLVILLLCGIFSAFVIHGVDSEKKTR